MQKEYLDPEFLGKILKDFVRINTCQPHGNEMEMVKEILSLFPEDIEYETISHGTNRASLIIKIAGKSDENGAAFVGHLDTVPYGDEATWKYPPLAAVEEGETIYGRGTADMKAGDAAMVATALSLLKLPQKPVSSIYFCFSADEENGGMGAVALSQAKCLVKVREFFIAEPSDACIGISEKGALWFKLSVHGVLAHSSKPDKGINAIEAAVEFRNRLSAHIDQTTSDPYLGRNTIAVTRLTGGVSTNVVPDTALMELDIRTLTDVDHEELIRLGRQLITEMESQTPGLQMVLDILNNRPAVGVSEDDELVVRVERTYQRLGLPVKKKGLYFYTDASQIIPKLHKPFVIIGPGDDALAHQCDEHVEIASVVRMAAVYTEYLKEYYYEEEGI